MSLSFERTQSVAIIGGGPGGYEAALAAAQLGAEVTVVERAGIGGSAVITDVVPSKTLIATADAAVAIRGAGELGVQLFAKSADGKPMKPEIAINLSAVNKRLLSLARQQSDDMRASLSEAGVRIISGHGRLERDDAVIVSTGPGGTDFDRIEADTFVISTGSSPRELPTAMPDGERILTWTQLYSMQSLPEHLIVVGSGVTGAEFAAAYMNLGAKVTLVSSRDQVLPGEDTDAAAVLERVFKRGGMNVLSKSRADKVERVGDGVLVTLSDGRTVEGSHCLMAVGIDPQHEGDRPRGGRRPDDGVGPHPGEPRRAHVGAERLRGRRLHHLRPARLGRLDAGPHRRVPRARRRRDPARAPPDHLEHLHRARDRDRRAGRRRTSPTASSTAWCTSCRSRRTRARR